MSLQAGAVMSLQVSETGRVRRRQTAVLLTALPAFAIAAGALLALAALPAPAAAHEVPPNVLVRAFVKPDGERLRVLVRVPLEAMRDVEFPLDGPGYLRFADAGPSLREAAELWVAGGVTVFADGVRLGDPRLSVARASLPSDRSFGSYAAALEHMHGALVPDGTQLFWQHALLDVMLEYDIVSDRAALAVDPGFAHLGLRTTTVLHFLPATGGERVLQFTGDPGLVRLDPRWYQSALLFTKLGFLHILDGLDHLLFLLCLVIPFRRLGPLILVVTSFTVAHSITLIAATSGFAPDALWFPPLIEVLIALSIVYMAFENIVGPKLERRWAMAFAFGLIHGFGFSFLLRDSLQFAGTHLTAALLAFNVGVELGQIAVLLLAVPLLHVLYTRVVKERIGVILLSALVAHSAWHWMTERAGDLRQYSFALPTRDAALAAASMRWLLLLLLVGAAALALHALAGRLVPVPAQVALQPPE
jgi:hypothetical protein